MKRWLPRGACGWGWLLTLGVSSVAGGDDVFSVPRFLTTSNQQQSAPVLTPSGDRETIRERYPNRNIKLERQVAQDADGNYVNHGSWTMWDEKGRVLGAGEYVQGQRQGVWVRNFEAGEAEVLNGPLSKQFSPPFVSTATFVDDQLHGTWTIVDSQDRPVFEWNYERNQRHGRCAWFYPNGEKWREVEYDAGEPHGEFAEWAPDGALLARESYDQGRQRLMQVEYYSPGQKKAEAQFLLAREVTTTELDWWRGVSRIKVTGKEGADVRHGSFVMWHRNGQKAMEGEYRYDLPEGTFHFWHANGQKAIEGTYARGEQQGKWTWWHDNGLKAIQGEYDEGLQSGNWSWWNPEGKLAETALYTESTSAGEPTFGIPARTRLESATTPPQLRSIAAEPMPVERSTPQVESNAAPIAAPATVRLKDPPPNVEHLAVPPSDLPDLKPAPALVDRESNDKPTETRRPPVRQAVRPVAPRG